MSPFRVQIRWFLRTEGFGESVSVGCPWPLCAVLIFFLFHLS